MRAGDTIRFISKAYGGVDEIGVVLSMNQHSVQFLTKKYRFNVPRNGKDTIKVLKNGRRRVSTMPQEDLAKWFVAELGQTKKSAQFWAWSFKNPPFAHAS